MLFTQVRNDLNEDVLFFLNNEGMEYYEDTINYETVFEYVFTQYPLKCGLKELGKNGDMAVTEDLYQLHMRDKFHPKPTKHLTKKQKRDALKSLIFSKFKRDRRVKEQTCADGRKQ